MPCFPFGNLEAKWISAHLGNWGPDPIKLVDSSFSKPSVVCSCLTYRILDRVVLAWLKAGRLVSCLGRFRYQSRN